MTEIKKKTHISKKKEGEDRDMIIYKIEIAGTDFLYVGSTQDYEQRKTNHCSACRHNLNPESKNMSKNAPLYNEINKHGGWEKVTMTPVEKINVKYIIDGRIREQYWIDKIQVARRDAVMLNCCSAYVTPEIRQERIKKNQAQTLKRNNTRVICDCGKEFSLGNKLAHQKSKNHQKWIKEEDEKFAKRLDEELTALLDE